MMAARANKWPASVFTFVLFSLLVSGAVSSSKCVDGTYNYGWLKCCKCGIGLYVKTHCTANQPTECELCNVDTFSSQPTSQMSCEPCTSCSQENANLEEEEKCTSAENRKCRCKKDHYCVSGTDPCTLCSRCVECPKGIKEPCKGHNNTVCDNDNDNDKIEGADDKVMIVVIIFAIVLILVGVGAGVWWYRRKKQKQNTSSQHPNGNVPISDVELREIRPLINVPEMDLKPHLPDIADVIGWNDMKDIAMRNVPQTQIENCVLNNQGNAHQQTVELLGIWVESQGFAAGDKLYKILENSGKMLKAEQVRRILLPG